MSLPFTSVVSLHTNTYGCGVARFSKMLAERIGVPFVGFDGGTWGDHPLFSLKLSEFDSYSRLIGRDELPYRYGVFWHDAGDYRITQHATHVFYADPSLGSPGLWCPSLITPRKRPVKLFSFGMAGRLQPDKYRRVRQLLDAAEQPYHLRVSVGLHEGTSLDGAEQHFDALKQIMGPEHVTILGILSDDAVSEELSNCDYVLAFFEKGLRANNTTVHAALDAGGRVLSNFDEHTSHNFNTRVWDINRMRRWMPDTEQCFAYSWDNLIAEMAKVCAASPSTAAR